MQNLKPIRVFLEVAEQQSFAAAARNFRMTPATVTRVVAKLEEDLGHQLLVRTTRQVSLTSHGALVAARYRPVVEEFDRISQELNRETQPFRGKLSITAPLSFGMRTLPALIDSFRLAYPHIQVHLQLTDTKVDMMASACDIAIRISAPPTDKSTIWRKICAIPRYVVAAPALLDRLGRPQHPDDLNPSYCISYSSNNEPEKWAFKRNGTRRLIRAESPILSNSGDFLYSLVLKQAGLAVLPDFIVTEGLESGKAEAILCDWPIEPLWLSLFYPPYEALPPLVATFTDFFEAYLSDAQGYEVGG